MENLDVHICKQIEIARITDTLSKAIKELPIEDQQMKIHRITEKLFEDIDLKQEVTVIPDSLCSATEEFLRILKYDFASLSHYFRLEINAHPAIDDIITIPDEVARILEERFIRYFNKTDKIHEEFTLYY